MMEATETHNPFPTSSSLRLPTPPAVLYFPCTHPTKQPPTPRRLPTLGHARRAAAACLDRHRRQPQPPAHGAVQHRQTQRHATAPSDDLKYTNKEHGYNVWAGCEGVPGVLGDACVRCELRAVLYLCPAVPPVGPVPHGLGPPFPNTAVLWIWIGQASNGHNCPCSPHLR